MDTEEIDISTPPPPIHWTIRRTSLPYQSRSTTIGPPGAHPLPYSHFGKAKEGEARTWAIMNIIVVSLVIIYMTFWTLYTFGFLTSSKPLAHFNDDKLSLCVFGGASTPEKSILVGTVMFVIGLAIYLFGCFMFLAAVVLAKKKSPTGFDYRIRFVRLYQFVIPIPVVAVVAKLMSKVNKCFDEGMFWGYHIMELGFTAIWLYYGWSNSDSYIKWLKDPEGVQESHDEPSNRNKPTTSKHEEDLRKNQHYSRFLAREDSTTSIS